MAMTLKNLKVGETAVITAVGGKGALRQHFLDMGVIPGAEVTVVKLAPMGDPMELQIHGYALTLRLAEAEQIAVAPVRNRAARHSPVERFENAERPGPDEGGRPLPGGTTLTFALVGNQNCGKTTLFNQLTGANQHVGNFPGVTVDRKDGPIRGRPGTLVTDLPGIYSMSPYSSEEIISRGFVLDEKPHAIINVVDATSMERSLYLTMQLLEMGVPMVVALNMMDEVTGNNGSIDAKSMAALLGVPVVPISAAKSQGVRELVDCAVRTARYQKRPVRRDFCSLDNYGRAIQRAIRGAEAILQGRAGQADLPLRFSAVKAVEGDGLILEQLRLDRSERDAIEHIAAQLEREAGMDRAAAIAGMRFDFIEYVCARTVRKPRVSRERLQSERIDRVLTGKWTAVPCFFVIMGLVFYLTFHVVGAFFQELLAAGIDALAGAVDGWMAAAHVNALLRSLVLDGVFGGVGSVLSFLPIVVTLFFFLSIMEDSGYAARVAFFMDKPLRRIGLSGRSIVPMLIGFGCTVPAVMAARTLPSRRDQRLTILLTPFMSCTAKLPIYAFFAGAFFPEQAGLIMAGLYLLGIAAGIAAALLFQETLFKGGAAPFVMELPNYRMPTVKNTARLLWEKARDFLTRAFGIILLAAIVVWFLQRFDPALNTVDDPSQSLMAAVGGLLAPVLCPLGLGDWRIVTALVSGFMAKESVVSTLEILFAGDIRAALTPAAAVTLLVFSLLYTPCVASIAAIRRELGGRWAVGVVVWQCTAAWIAAFFARGLCLAVGL